jgi:hypothetical protein
MKLATWILLGCMAAAPALAQDLCSAATASVTITGLEVGETSIAAKGTWQVGGGAVGILLDYRIDNGRGQMESRAGASGSWDIARMEPGDKKCGRHTLRVYAYPSVQDGAKQLHCVAQGSSEPRQFEISCTPKAEIADCQWECSGGETPQCSGNCSAGARLGRPGYLPFWGLNGEGWQQGAEVPSEGPWSHPVTCAPGQRISFKVRDRNGRGLWSEVDEIGCGVTE